MVNPAKEYAIRTKLDKWIERGFMGFVSAAICLFGWVGQQAWTWGSSVNTEIAAEHTVNAVQENEIATLGIGQNALSIRTDGVEHRVWNLEQLTGRN